MKIEFAIKPDVKGEVATGAKNIVFEDVGNNMNNRQRGNFYIITLIFANIIIWGLIYFPRIFLSIIYD